jgi:transposase
MTEQEYEAALAALRAEAAAMQAENARLRADLTTALALITQLEERLADREGGPPPPAFVRANTPRRAGEQRPRQTRDRRHNAGRRREEPTRVVEQALERCPDCGYALRGHSVARTRQIVDLPAPGPLVVTEHRLLKRHCPVCQRWHTPRADWRGLALGQGRFGVRLASLVAYLRSVARLPLAAIQQVLAALHGLRLSRGALVSLLRGVAQETAPEQEALLAQVRASAIVHMDETGWREDGQNGYLWTLSTAGTAPTRYFAHDHSRAGSVATGLLGAFSGHLVSDFYAGYNRYGGKHQRCWVHLLRDLHVLKEAHAGDGAVVAWAQDVRALYDAAQERLRGPTPLSPAQRAVLYRRLEDQAHALGLRHSGRANKGHPCHALCHRLLRHQGELFQFVRVPGLAADNNLAERSLRPRVIARKISGGTRSAAGTQTRCGLDSLFATWQARDLNPFAECLALLHSRLPQT